MKTIRNLFVFFVLALVTISCEKSDIRPAQCGMVETKDAKTTTISDQQQVNGRVMGLQHEGTVTPEPEPDVDDIVGSGDDDRDGGDKKAKAVGR